MLRRNSLTQRRLSLEGLESRNLMTILVSTSEGGMYSEPKETKEETFPIADSFSFGVEREMKESGEKSGTEDINIGVGELQECSISEPIEVANTELAEQVFAESSGDESGVLTSEPLNYEDVEWTYSAGEDTDVSDDGDMNWVVANDD